MTTSVNPAADAYAFLNGSKGAAATGSSQELGQNEFLHLMIAQLRNQDPFKPTDPTQFLSQLAQFSQVTSMQNVQSSIETLAGSLRSTQVLNGTSLVGHDVLAPATSNTIEAGAQVKGAAEVPKGASAVDVVVRDSAGALVRRFSMPTGSGLQEFTWDGLDAQGNAVPAGTYDFEIIANVGGESIALDPMITTRVSSVTIDPSSGSLTLNTSTGAVPITDVRRVL
jgi:flagellar basal-body rod modification protein FlgD